MLLLTIDAEATKLTFLYAFPDNQTPVRVIVEGFARNLNQIAFMLIAIPIFEPLVKVYGFDPIWFWALFLINIALGAVTPPFGHGLFALKASATGLSMAKSSSAA